MLGSSTSTVSSTPTRKPHHLLWTQATHNLQSAIDALESVVANVDAGKSPEFREDKASVPQITLAEFLSNDGATIDESASRIRNIAARLETLLF